MEIPGNSLLQREGVGVQYFTPFERKCLYLLNILSPKEICQIVLNMLLIAITNIHVVNDGDKTTKR